MTAVSAWIVDPQGRPVPGVDVLLTAQGWRGQRWAARSDARGRATFEVPPVAMRGGGRWTVALPGGGASRSGRMDEALILTVPSRPSDPRHQLPMPTQLMSSQPGRGPVPPPPRPQGRQARNESYMCPPRPLAWFCDSTNVAEYLACACPSGDPGCLAFAETQFLTRQALAQQQLACPLPGLGALMQPPNLALIATTCFEPAPAFGQPCRQAPCPACGPGMECVQGICCSPGACPPPGMLPGQPCTAAVDGCGRRCRPCAPGLTCINGRCCGPQTCPATAPTAGAPCSSVTDGCGNDCRACGPGLACNPASNTCCPQNGTPVGAQPLPGCPCTPTSQLNPATNTCCPQNGTPVGAQPLPGCPCAQNSTLSPVTNTCCPNQGAALGQTPLAGCPCGQGLVSNGIGPCCPQNQGVGSACNAGCPCPAPMQCINGQCCFQSGNGIVQSIPYNDKTKGPFKPKGTPTSVWVLDKHGFGSGALVTAVANGKIGSAQPCGHQGCSACPPGESCFRVVRHLDAVPEVSAGWELGGGAWEATNCTANKPCISACMCMGPAGPGIAQC